MLDIDATAWNNATGITQTCRCGMRSYSAVTEEPGATRWIQVWPGGMAIGAPELSVKVVMASAVGFDHVPWTSVPAAKTQTSPVPTTSGYWTL